MICSTVAKEYTFLYPIVKFLEVIAVGCLIANAADNSEVTKVWFIVVPGLERGNSLESIRW